MNHSDSPGVPLPEPLLGTAAVPGSRPSWSGLLQFSLVNAPVKAYPAVANREISHFHQLHADCGQRIRHAKHCPVHGPVDAAAIVKGYEYGRDQHVVLDPDELDALRPAQDRALRLERFVAPGQCDPILFSGRQPAPAARRRRGGAGLRSVARKPAAKGSVGGGATGARAASANWSCCGRRERCCCCTSCIIPRLSARRHGRAAGAAAVGRRCNWRLELIDAASGPVDWSAYADQTAAELRALVEAKIQGQTPRPAEPAVVVLPLLEALQQSVAQLETGRENQARVPRRARRRNATAVGMILPDLLPMLAVPASPFDSPEYVFEVKYDGVRALAAVEAEGVRLWGRERSGYTARYPEAGGVAPLAAGHLGGRRTGGAAGGPSRPGVFAVPARPVRPLENPVGGGLVSGPLCGLRPAVPCGGMLAPGPVARTPRAVGRVVPRGAVGRGDLFGRGGGCGSGVV